MTHLRRAPLEPAHADAAFALFRGAYLRARRANPLLPDLTPDHEARLRGRVERACAHGGVAAWRGPALRGYLVASPPFDFRGARAALVPEYAHAAADDEPAEVIADLYGAVADRLVRDGVPLHLIGHLTADDRVTAVLFDLGFGAIVRERLRDITDVRVADEARGRHEAALARVERVAITAPWDEFASLAAEHAAFYRASPVFVRKDESLGAAAEELEAQRAAGDALFVARADDGPVAYLVVGRCHGVAEGRLLAGSATAQVRSAYTRPAHRRRGIAGALLQHAVKWARLEGYERLFVEHETANPLGSAFWARHFAPFVTFSLRYVDRRLAEG